MEVLREGLVRELREERGDNCIIDAKEVEISKRKLIVNCIKSIRNT